MNEETATWINRGYCLDVFDQAVRKLKQRGIEFVAHVIFGLPGETQEDMLKTIEHLKVLGVNGVKIHLLHIIDGTKLNEIYEVEPFPVLKKKSI